MVVRWNSCCNSEYACGSTAGLGSPAPKPGGTGTTAAPLPGGGTHKFFCTVAIRSKVVCTEREEAFDRHRHECYKKIVCQVTFHCQRKMRSDYPSVAKACIRGLGSCVIGTLRSSKAASRRKTMQRRHFGVSDKLRSGVSARLCWFGMHLASGS